VMENIKENVSKNKNEQSQNDVQGVSSLNDTYAENPIKISKEKFSINSLLFSYLTGFRVFRYTSLSFNTSTALATS